MQENVILILRSLIELPNFKMYTEVVGGYSDLVVEADGIRFIITENRVLGEDLFKALVFIKSKMEAKQLVMNAKATL